VSLEKLYGEKEILLLVAQGNELAFEKLFNHYSNRIYSVALRLAHSTSIAEEVVQDVFLKIWSRRAGLTEIKDFSAYLYTVAKNEVYQMLHRLARQQQVAEESEAEREPYHNETDLFVLSRDYERLLVQAVDKLPPQQKKIYQLMKEQGLKREETARLLNLHPETVKTHLAQAMRNIRASLKYFFDSTHPKNPRE
jgi:RNA polymerase sigma-70 factor (family 1)